eukprot:scaffold228_cov437-Pavlova_lutheri.AAC.7
MPVSLSANGKTPLELLTGTPTPTSHLRVFGCKAWVLIPEAKRSSKFGARSVPGIFIGYQNNSTYRVLVDDKVVTSRNVFFVENKLPVSKQTSDSQPEVVAYLLAEPPQFSMESEGSHHESEDHHLISRRAVQPSFADVPLSQQKSDWPAIENSAATTPAAHRKPASPDNTQQSMMSRDEGATHAGQVTPSALPHMVYFLVAPTNPAMVDGEAPTAISHPYNLRSRGNKALEAAATRQWEISNDFSGYARAMARLDADLWQEAITDELTSLAKSGTWRLVPLPPC